jgi:hypothetical protein
VCTLCFYLDYDVKVRVKELKLGDLVYQLDTATVKGKTRKLSPSWKGPGVVIEKLTPYLYKIKLKRVMITATRADKISHGLCLFPCYLYTFAMIPFFALVTPDHELSPVWFPTNTRIVTGLGERGEGHYAHRT